MSTYTESKYYFYRMILSIAANNVLVLEKKTALSYRKEIIPLTVFSPEPKVIQKKLSKTAKWLFAIELVAMIGFFLMVSDPSLSGMINIPIASIFLSFTAMVSIYYYFYETKSRLCFFAHNGYPIFLLSLNKKDLLKKWVKELNVAVINAKIHFNQSNYLKMRKGIDILEKQNLINKSFAEELHRRANIADISLDK